MCFRHHAIFVKSELTLVLKRPSHSRQDLDRMTGVSPLPRAKTVAQAV